MAKITIHNEKFLYKRSAGRFVKMLVFVSAVTLVLLSFGGPIFGGSFNSLHSAKPSQSDRLKEKIQNEAPMQDDQVKASEDAPQSDLPVNHLPGVDNVILTLKEGDIATGDLLASDEDGDRVTFSIAQKPAKGEVALTPEGTYEYKPGSSFSGSDEFWFLASDGKGSVKGKVTLMVEGTNKAPVFRLEKHYNLTVKKAFSLKIGASDTDGDKLTYGVKSLPSGASYVAGTRTFKFTPLRTGTYRVVFWVKDKEVTRTQTVELVVGAAKKR